MEWTKKIYDGKIEAIIKPHAVMYLPSTAMAAIHLLSRSLHSVLLSIYVGGKGSALTKLKLDDYKSNATETKTMNDRRTLCQRLLFDDQYWNDVYRMALI